jgi:plastocyanin
VGRGAALALGCATLACAGATEPPAATAEIRVEIVVEGIGFSGVGVTLYPTADSAATASATTDAEGTASFAGLAPGSYDVYVSVPEGFAVQADAPDRRTVNPAAGQIVTVTFTLVAPGPGPDLVIIEMTAGYAFSPATVTISPRTTVRWVNVAAVYHTITPDGHQEWAEAEVFQESDSFQHFFTTAGEFPYYCVPHVGAGMVGTITVAIP